MACLGLLALALSGCGAFYWGKPGGTAEQFERDSVECAKQATPAAAGSLYGLGSESIYKTCLRSRGWVREQKSSPEPGWFRGIEGWH
jgi:hypothetical protein